MQSLVKYFWFNLALLFIVFFISVAIRFDNLKAPMGRHHEWLTGHVLSTLSIFEENGMANHYFSPVFTFNAKAERALLESQTFKDKNNYTYYTSYPPFCFIFPYLLFKTFHLKVSVLGIRIIGLLIQFFCAFLLYLIINEFFNKKLSGSPFIPSIIGYSLYLFSSGNLWFHANIYFADMLVHLFILGSLLTFIKIIKDPGKNYKLNMVLLFFLTFFGVYTEWLALFVAFYMGLFTFILGFKNKKLFYHLIILIISASSAISLSIYQYSSIAGFEPLKQKTVEKYAMRSGHDKEHAEAGYSFGSVASKNRLFNHYESNYGSLLDYAWFVFYIVLLLIILNLIHKKTSINKNHLIVFGILFFSIVTHHYVFFNFTVVHDFSTLKSTLILILFISYIIGLYFTYSDGKYLTFNSIVFTIITIWFIHNSIQNYYKVNKQDTSSLYQIVCAETIKQFGKKDEIIFSNSYITPVIWYYAQRNLTEANSLNGCVNFLKMANYPKGLFVRILDHNKAFDVSATRININGDSVNVYSEHIDYHSLEQKYLN